MQYEPFLEPVCRDRLTTLAAAFAVASGKSVATVGGMVAGDRAFFDRIGTGGFTVKMYDRIMGRFSGIWPDDVPWPDGVPRPEPIPLIDVRDGKRSPDRDPADLSAAL